MRNLTQSNITDAVLQSIDGAQSPRLKQIFTSLIRHLHDFTREVELTHEEWEAAVDFCFKAGQISTPVRQEFILASDVLGVSSLVDIINDKAAQGATETSVLGPFFIEGSPELAEGGDMIEDNPGDPGVVFGRVLDPDGLPIAGALMEVWQTAANGQYQAVDPSQPEGNLRRRMRTDTAGRYFLKTIKPVSYKVPVDGPTGDMLHAMGRHAWRPAHIHFKIKAEGFLPLVTQLFEDTDTYIDEDAVFGVRDSLAVSFQPNHSEEEAAKYDLKAPFWKVEYDFGLRKA